MPTWPDWWEWDLELSSHLLKRMVDRDFTEIDVRRMLIVANVLGPDIVPGRWVVASRHRRRAWEVTVEPDAARQVFVVVTAYPLD